MRGGVRGGVRGGQCFSVNCSCWPPFKIVVGLGDVTLLYNLFLANYRGARALGLSAPSINAISDVKRLSARSLPLPDSAGVVVSGTARGVGDSGVRDPTVGVTLPVGRNPLGVRLADGVGSDMFSPITTVCSRGRGVVRAVPSSSFGCMGPQLSGKGQLITRFSFFPSGAVSTTGLVVCAARIRLRGRARIVRPTHLSTRTEKGCFPRTGSVPVPRTLANRLIVSVGPCASRSFFNSGSGRGGASGRSLGIGRRAIRCCSRGVRGTISRSGVPGTLDLLRRTGTLRVSNTRRVFMGTVGDGWPGGDSVECVWQAPGGGTSSSVV